jgi:hypothetical protein
MYMKIIDKDSKWGPRKAYAGVNSEYKIFSKGIRVLPAPYFEDRKIMFTFVAQYDPGTPGWLEGGYEVVGPTGDFRAYYLDQLILHPEIIKRRHQTDIETNKSGLKRGRKGGEPKVPKVGGTGKRGRPAVDPALRKNKPYVATGLPRGRRKKVE